MNVRAKMAWGLVVLAALLHWDFWYWGDSTLVFGFMPVGLAYQAGISILAAVGWTCVVIFAWPEDVEAWADANDPGPNAAAGEERP